jgi:hypothetical protein
MFGGLYFGQYWAEEAGIPAGGEFVPDPGGSEKRKKHKKKVEPAIAWPQPWDDPNYRPPEPKKVPAVAQPASEPAVAKPAVVSQPPAVETVAALSKSLASGIHRMDAALLKEAAALQARLNRELADEEILMLMGFFD